MGHVGSSGALEDRQVVVAEKVDEVQKEVVDILEVVVTGNNWEVG